jgi:hypothetical protein
MMRGDPIGEVEDALRDFYIALNTGSYSQAKTSRKKYAPKTSSLAVTACCSFLRAHGFPVPRRFIRMSQDTQKEIRRMEREEVESVILHAGSLEKKTLLTVMAECPARPRVFPEWRWGWLEKDWHKRDVAHVWLPKKYRPNSKGGPVKFEPICFIGPRGIEMLKKLHDSLAEKGIQSVNDAKLFPSCSYRALNSSFKSACARAAKLGDLRSSEGNEENITPKSFRKFIFNIIDDLEGISPEYRTMLKGRDLGVEKYYSKTNIEALRRIYGEKIYPAIWGLASNPSAEPGNVVQLNVHSLEWLLAQAAQYPTRIPTQVSFRAPDAQGDK